MASSTVDRFFSVGTELPTAKAGRMFFLLDSINGNRLYACFTAGTWTEVAASSAGAQVDNETPAGTRDGANDTFTLAHTPSPAGSLLLFLDGIYQVAGVDYTLTTATIVFAAAPQVTDNASMDAFYRYTA